MIKIKKINMCSKLNIKNSIIIQRILTKSSFIFIKFELNFVFYQFDVLFNFVKQTFIVSISYYNLIKNYYIQYTLY